MPFTCEKGQNVLSPVEDGICSAGAMSQPTSFKEDSWTECIPCESLVRSPVMPYLRYRNGCVFLGKYAAYTVSMAFLKEVDSTRRSRK